MERSRATALATVGLLLAGGLAWLASGGDGGTARAARPDRVGRAASRPADATAAELAAERADDVARGAFVAPAVEATAPAAAPAASARAFEAPLERGVRIRVVRGHPGVGVPHAEVAYALAPADGPRRRLEQRAGRTAWHHGLGEARWYRADAEGRLVLPASRRGAVATCTDAGDFGVLHVERAAVDEQVLRLLPDHGLAVRVVRGAERAPVADAPVGVRYSLGPGNGEILDRARTDASGVARFEHVREYAGWYWPHTEELAVVLLGVFEAAPAVAFDPEAPPETIELEEPPSGLLVVDVVEADGTPPSAPVLVRAALEGEDPFDDGGAVAAEIAEDGRATFERVQPGIEVAIRVDRAASSSEAGRANARSAPAGGTAHATVALGARAPTVRARVLDAQGPLVEREVWVGLGKVEQGGFRQGTRTDAEGRIAQEFDTQWTAGPELALTIETVETAPDALPLAAQLRLQGPLAPGGIDLGDVVLEPARPIVSGRVVDARGEPIEGAWVRALQKLDRGRRMVGRDVSAADGAFAIVASFDGAILQVDAGHPFHAAPREPVEVRAGTRDVVLALPAAAGRLRGNVLLEQAWFADFVIARARVAGAEAWTQQTSLDRPGAFTIDGLAPGRYDVGIGFGEEQPAAIVRDVAVEAGRFADDPRLAAIDLRATAKLISLEFVGPAGEPVESGQIWTRPSGGHEWSDVGWIENGVGHVFTGHPRLDLYVYAQKYQVAYVPGVDAAREIALAAAPRARFHWAEPPPERNGIAFYASLSMREPDMPEIATWISLEKAPGEGETRYLPAAGRASLVWRYAAMEQGSMRWREEVIRQPIELVDRAEVHDYPVTMPAELRAWIEAHAPADADGDADADGEDR